MLHELLRAQLVLPHPGHTQSSGANMPATTHPCDQSKGAKTKRSCGRVADTGLIMQSSMIAYCPLPSIAHMINVW